MSDKADKIFNEITKKESKFKNIKERLNIFKTTEREKGYRTGIILTSILFITASAILGNIPWYGYLVFLGISVVGWIIWG